MTHTIHYSYHNPDGRGILLTSPVYSHCVEKKVNEKYKDDINCDDDDGRVNISPDDG